MRAKTSFPWWAAAVALVVLGTVLAPVATPSPAGAAAAPLKIDASQVIRIPAESASETPLTVTGGTPPYRWAQRTSGPEWRGMALSVDGVLHGSPYIDGVATLLVRVFDATGAHTDASIQMEIIRPPLFQTSQVPDGYRGTPYTAQLRVTDGLAPLSLTVSSGTVPPGLEVRPHREGESGDGFKVLAGTPTAVGSWSFTLLLADAMGRTTTRELSVQVHEPTVPAAPEYEPSLGGFNSLYSGGVPFDGGAPITAYVITPHRDGTALTPLVYPVDSPLDLLGRLPKGTYRFTIAARNRVGTGAAGPMSPPIQVFAQPGVPTGVQAVAGNRSATVTWTAPEDGGEPIDRYVVEALDESGSVVRSERVSGSPTSPTTAVIGDLVLGKTYRFRVWAGSLHYGGPSPSALSDPFVAIAWAGVPTDVAASPRNGSAVVRWTAPTTTGGSPVTGWVITPQIGGAPQAPHAVSGTATTATVPGLANGTTYTFTVAAVNGAGGGPASAASNPVQPSAAAIGASAPAPGPVAPLAGGARVSWTAPLSDGGSPVTGYRVTPYIGTAPQLARTFASTATTQDITGLVDGTTYTFRVAAVNAAGVGAASDPTEPVIAGSPAAPTEVTVRPGASSILVSWSAPSGNGVPVTGYVVTPYIGDRAQPSIVSGSAATSFRVTGLEVGRSYRYRVAAVNSRGVGLSSALTEDATAGAAATPTSITVVPRATSVKVTWAAPGPLDAPVSTYAVAALRGSVVDADVGAPGSATSVTLTGLKPGVSYRIRLWAFNGVGASPDLDLGSVVVGLPDAVAGARALPGNGTATVVAVAPAPDAAAVTSYRVTPVVNGVAKATQTFPGTATSWKVTGLANGTVHTFRIVAVNQHGASPVATTAAMRVGVPRPSIDVKAKAGRKQATVTWADSANNGAAIVRYVVTPYRNGIAQPSVAFDARSKTRVLTGLTTGASYTFTVRATNSRGTSEASVPSAAVRVT